MNGSGDWLWPLARPAAWLPLIAGASSIASLLLYFFGVGSLGQAARWTLLPAVLILGVFFYLERRAGDLELTDRVLAGLWAGALATLAYDVVRVPISASGVPVFKAISYFGTLMLDLTRPTLASEAAGWTYHLSNGIGFGLVYTVALSRPRLWTALAWGLVLEGVMLLTPYAEVLGYRISPTMLAITIGSHLVYGVVLWAALMAWRWTRARPNRTRLRFALLLLAVVGVAAISADTFERHAETIPPSPPSYIGRHLYTTWSVPEPDRVAVLWLIRTFVDPDARFHFVEPFSQIRFGRPVDLPEAELRRSGTRSAAERLIQQHGLADEPRLQSLAEMTHLFEIARWRLLAQPAAHQLGLDLIEAVGDCDPTDVRACMERGISFLDNWYGR